MTTWSGVDSVELHHTCGPMRHTVKLWPELKSSLLPRDSEAVRGNDSALNSLEDCVFLFIAAAHFSELLFSHGQQYVQKSDSQWWKSTGCIVGNLSSLVNSTNVQHDKGPRLITTPFLLCNLLLYSVVWESFTLRVRLILLLGNRSIFGRYTVVTLRVTLVSGFLLIIFCIDDWVLINIFSPVFPSLLECFGREVREERPAGNGQSFSPPNRFRCKKEAHLKDVVEQERVQNNKGYTPVVVSEFSPRLEWRPFSWGSSKSFHIDAPNINVSDGK